MTYQVNFISETHEKDYNFNEVMGKLSHVKGSENYLKDIFLKSLRSTSGKLKYKRYACSPLRYAGGKSLAVGIIIELLPNVKKLVSPFFGGGSVEIACANKLGIKVIGYDIFSILVNYWQVQIKTPIVLSKYLEKFEPTKEGFKKIKEILKKHWKGIDLIKDDIALAAYYYFNHNTSYGPHFLGSPSSVYLQQERYDTLINKVKNFSAPNLSVYCDSFENTIVKHHNNFLYCDPPLLFRWKK